MSIVNSFYKESQIKKRIKMLTKNNSKVIHKLKYIAILPLVFVMMFISSCTSQEQDEAESVVKSKELDKTSRVEEVDDDIPFSIVQEVPVYPGCENRTNEEKKACLNKSMQNFVTTEFDSNLVKNLGLEPGNKRIFALFKIDIDGNVVDIRVRAPHKDLEKEAIRTIQNLPQMQPGKSEGKAVGVKYVLPIVFKVE
jgi:protein TonB